MESANQSQKIDLETANQALELIKKAEKILIISHRNPDPDSLGSNFSLRMALEKQLDKQIISGCIDKAPSTFSFHPYSNTLTSEIDLNEFDLIISVDCGSLDQVALHKIYPQLLEKQFINIDHHASNNNYGTVNLVYTRLSSTCEIIFKLFKIWNLKFEPAISTLLLYGLYYDTGSFKHSNVNSEVLEMAGELMQNGANLQTITDNMYKQFTQSKFHLWGEVLNNFKLKEEQNSDQSKHLVAAAAINLNTFYEKLAKTEELSGIIELLTSLPQADLAVTVYEDGKGNLKGSLRTTKDNINLSEMASKLGGGGHKKASGFSFPGKITYQENWKITP